MNKREKAWALVEECRSLYTDEIREALAKAEGHDPETIKSLLARLDAGEIVTLEKTPAERYFTFWYKNKKLKEAGDKILQFLMDNFPLDEQNLDTDSFKKEVQSVLRMGSDSSLEDCINFDVSDNAFPLLVLRLAIIKFHIRLIDTPTFKRFALPYTKYIVETKNG